MWCRWADVPTSRWEMQAMDSRDSAAAVAPLPRRRTGETVQVAISGARGHLTVGRYPDGRVAEVDLRLGKQGSTLAGTLDALSTAISAGLQAGVPAAEFADALRSTRFEPCGPTDDPDVPWASSPADYLAHRMS